MWGPGTPRDFLKNNLLGNMGPETPADFLKLMPGSELGYFCGNVGPWDPERLKKKARGPNLDTLGKYGP